MKTRTLSDGGAAWPPMPLAASKPLYLFLL
jgi:hypothetical protein